MNTIGVFDSGKGGLHVVREIERELPGARVLFRDDREHMPYGSKSGEEIYRLTRAAVADLVEQGAEIVVLACNTATGHAIAQLREEFAIPFVGIEPMIKPAVAASKTGVIAVLATPATLASEKYRELKNRHAAGITVLEPDCTSWADQIERDAVDDLQIASVVNSVLANRADQIVLGCTHYHWLSEQIAKMAAGKAQVLQPSSAIARRVQKILGGEDK